MQSLWLHDSAEHVLPVPAIVSMPALVLLEMPVEGVGIESDEQQAAEAREAGEEGQDDPIQAKKT